MLQLVFRNTNTAQIFKVNVTGSNTDVRIWRSGQAIALNKTVTLPTMPPGTYDLLLHVSDFSNNNAVANKPEFSIQFANTGTWEASTGYNKLNKTVSITATTIPAPPANLVASPVSASQINLSWTASAGATSYSVERSATTGGPYNQVGSGLTSTSYSDTGLSASTTYYYVVKTINTSGTSAASTPANATTLSLAGTNITVDGNSNDWAGVSAISTNGFGGVAASLKVFDNNTFLYILVEGALDANYQVFIDTGNNSAGSAKFMSSDWTNSAFNYMVENGTLYQYGGNGSSWVWNSAGAISAVKNASVIELGIQRFQVGTLSPVIKLGVQSINAAWTTTGYIPMEGTSPANYTLRENIPAAPSGLIASVASSSQINLSWTASAGAISYSIERSTTNGGPYSQVATGVVGTAYNNTALVPSTTYYYVVKATNTTGTSGNSNQASATTTASIVVDGNTSDWSGIGTIATNGTATLKAADNTTSLFILVQGTSIDANYQLFLDTDNNSTGTKEYTGSSWPSTGFNYMIENGSLRSYNGAGTNWVWSLVGSVTAVKNSTTIEVQIPKSLLVGLTTTIKISAKNLNSAWSGVGYVPVAGGSGASYVMGSVSGRIRESEEGREEISYEIDSEKDLSVYPNPGRSNLTVDYYLTEEAFVSMDIIDLVGRHIMNVEKQLRPAGNYKVFVNIEGLGKKVYVLKFNKGGRVLNRLIKIE